METKLFAMGLLIAALSPVLAADSHSMNMKAVKPFLPDAAGSKIVSVTKAEEWDTTGITILTEAVAVKETGPKETVARFGEVYAFSPTFVAVHRNEPVTLHFRNLQPDDEHDFAVLDKKGKVLLEIILPPLQETSYVFTFHQEGIFPFKCTIHQPDMSGQFLVLPTDNQASKGQ